MEAHRPGQHRLLEIAAEPDQSFGGVAMADRRDLLADDRPLVELRGRVVRCGTDDLDPAVVRLVVRLGADERRQERVVDVDDPPGNRSMISGGRICM